MIDFTVRRNDSGLFQVMVSKARKQDHFWSHYASEITCIFRGLAEDMDADIGRVKGESYFLIDSNELGELYALVMGAECSVELV